MDDNLRKSIILENYSNPVNKKTINDDNYYKVNMNSLSCIDNLDFMVLIEDDIIKDAYFDGQACAISTSASSIMMKLIIGKSIEQVFEIIENYENMINEREYDEKILQEANVFNEIHKQANRKKCALLPFEGLKKILLESRGSKKNEK